MKHEFNLGFHFCENTKSQNPVQEGPREPDSVFFVRENAQIPEPAFVFLCFCAFAD